MSDDKGHRFVGVTQLGTPEWPTEHLSVCADCGMEEPGSCDDIPVPRCEDMADAPLSLEIGAAVHVDAIDGFYARGRVVESRDVPNTRYKVAVDDGSQPDFWAHDFELTPVDLAAPEPR